jgi:hypothetical protein
MLFFPRAPEGVRPHSTRLLHVAAAVEVVARLSLQAVLQVLSYQAINAYAPRRQLRAVPPGFIFSQGQCVSGAAPAPAPPVNLAYPLQTELKRIGCLRGAVDGVWGNGSRAALTNFFNRSGLAHLGSYSPSQAALDATYSKGPGFCPPVYVAPRPPTYQPPTYQPAPPTVPRQVRCSKVKYGFTRGNTCACSGGRIFTGTACVKLVQTSWQPGECRIIGGLKVCS